MKKLLLIFGLLLSFSCVARATTCNGYTITGSCYYLSPTGNDGHAGTSTGTAWLTPNHALNMGDMIVAAVGSYPLGNFGYTFGTVTGAGHGFAFLVCATFDACYVNGGTNQSGNNGIFVSSNHWAVMGFEVTNVSNSGNAPCFKAVTFSGSAALTDVLFIDDIANGCSNGGFITDPYEGYGVDYLMLIADISYNAAQATNSCTSGVSIYEPSNYDTLPGTHTYIAQYFGWGNVDPSVCNSEPATDGEGIILDTFASLTYTGQTVIENALSLWNGSYGIEVWNNTNSPIYVKNATTFANTSGPGLSASYCGEIGNVTSSGANAYVQISQNITRTNSATGCGGNTLYAYFAANVDGTNHIYQNLGYSAAGNNTYCSNTCTGFSFGPNNSFGTDPAFVSAPSSTPAAPSCGAYASVPACMASLIAAMKPTAAGTANYGYQPVSNTVVYDALYPQVLCNYQSELAGLVTQGCLTATVWK